jgi:hypothetical protein
MTSQHILSLDGKGRPGLLDLDWDIWVMWCLGAISKTRKGREMAESPENGCSRLFFIYIAIWLNLTCTCARVTSSIEFKVPYFK